MRQGISNCDRMKTKKNEDLIRSFQSAILSEHEAYKVMSSFTKEKMPRQKNTIRPMSSSNSLTVKHFLVHISS